MSLNEGPEKADVHRYGNSGPRYGVRTTMLSSCTVESFSGFHSQEISITLLYVQYVLAEPTQPTAKIRKKNDNTLSRREKDFRKNLFGGCPLETK